MALLATAPLFRVEEVYETAPPGAPRHLTENRDTDRARRLAAVVASYHTLQVEGGSLVLGWGRSAEQGPVVVFGTAAAATGVAGATTLSYPPGSRGRRLAPGEVSSLLGRFPLWTSLAGVPDGLLVEKPPTPAELEIQPNLADSLLGVWRHPFAWLVVARPVPPDEISATATQVANEERDARSRSSSPQQAVLADRLGYRHRELRMAESTGLWSVRLLAGGHSPVAARAVAGLLAAATDLSGLPYSLQPDVRVADLDAVLTDEDRGFPASSALVAALARPPSVEIPGVRVIPRSTFDVTPETGQMDAGRVESGQSIVAFGDVVDREAVAAGPLRVSTESLNRHTFVCGATGSGKSQTIRHILEETSRTGRPWLVIEPAKAEYQRMKRRLPGQEVLVIRPGDAAAPPVGINPLAPAEGFGLQTHADLTRALFIAAFQAEEPFPQVLAAALTQSYERLGWDLTLGEPLHPGVRPRYPTLGDLQTCAEQVVESIGYGREITDNVRGFIRVRLSSLRLGTTGRFFEGGHRLDLSRLLRRKVVLEIEDVGDDRDKAFLMGAVLIQLVEHLRVQDRQRPHDGTLRHITVIEEAHRLLRRPDQPGPAAHAVELFAALLAEVRAYGEGLIIAEQIPAKLVPDVIKNTAVKVVHRLPAQDDRDAVGATMNLDDEQSRFLVTLAPGMAAVFADGMDHPVLAAMPDGTKREALPAAEPDGAAGLAGIIGQPSGGCPAHCASDPCSLRRMTKARRSAREEPGVALWAELAVLGHLAGLPAPTPAPVLAARLAREAGRDVDCILRHAVEAAIASRSTVLTSSHSPDQFAAHVAAELRAQSTDATRCPDAPHVWLAPCFRWNVVRLALQDLYSKDPDAGRHPDSPQWMHMYGRNIPGDSCGGQLDTVRRWCTELLRDRPAIDATIFGAGTPSAIETAVGSTRDAPDWPAALRSACGNLVIERNWPAAYLTIAVPAETETTSR